MIPAFDLEKKEQLIVAFLNSRKLDASEMDDEDEDDEDDDDDFDFSPTSLKTKLPSKRIVEMKVLTTGSKVHVKCRLPWTWSWLQATVELKFPVTPRSSEAQQLIDGKFKVIQYHLDQSVGHNGVYAISLFLKDIKTTTDDLDQTQYDESKKEFCNWLERQQPQLVILKNLEQLLTNYEEEQTSRAIQVGIFRQLMNSCLAGQVFCLATNQPTFFRAAPILFPKKIMSMMKCSEDDSDVAYKKQKLLENLEVIAVEDPWKFGFSEIMYKETRFSGLEAPLFAMKNAWFYRDLSDLHRVSLVTYDLFKQTCKSRGHTYLLHHDMPTYFHFYTKFSKSSTNNNEESSMPSNGLLCSAIEFLIENEIVKREVKGAEERFHLMRYWRAEESICESLESILLSPSWVPVVDLDDNRFERIQSDAAQMGAAKCIVNNAVTIISGRGGTGKTEVVSSVLKAVEDGIRNEDKVDIEEDSLITEDGVNSEDSFMTKDKDENDPLQNSEEVKSSSNGPILYCAPTGKAASVIKKRVGSKAFTIHQILSSYKLWRSGQQMSPWKFAETRIVAVDECSMVSIEIFQFLLKYLIEGSNLTKVVLLGDHLQLPSVDPGNFMEDLFTALKPRGLTITLLTNHRSEGSIIFNNATKISSQQMPIFDAKRGFSLIVPQTENLNYLPVGVRKSARKLEPPSASMIQPVKSKGKKPDWDRMALYWALIRKYREEFSIVNDEKSQIISFLNNECAVLNQFGCFVYNKHLVWNGDGRRMKKQFSVGDKIICTKNSDVPLYVPKDRREKIDEEASLAVSKGLNITSETDGIYCEPEDLDLQTKTERLMNGNLYKIRAVCRGDVTSSGTVEEGDATGGTRDQSKDNNELVAASEGVTVSREYYVLDDLNGEIIRVNPDMLIKKTRITHAWALSIHKFQGSEADTIVYGLSGSNMESWKHVYTAVTRGKKSVVIVGKYQDLEKAIKRKPIKRQTALSEKVRKLMGGVLKKKEEMCNEGSNEGECNSTHLDDKQIKIDKWVSKIQVESIPKADSSLTPTKLSQIFSDSLGDWNDGDDDGAKNVTKELDNDVFSTGKHCNEEKSPFKRSISTSSEAGQIMKQLKPSRTSSTKALRSLSQTWDLDESEFQSGLLRNKRVACESPASYQSTCKFNSPLTYATRRVQPQPITPTTNTASWCEDSFQDLNCSQLENDAIALSQGIQTRKNMADVFGSDDSEDDVMSDNNISDDELVEAVRMSQFEYNQENRKLREAMTTS